MHRIKTVLLPLLLLAFVTPVFADFRAPILIRTNSALSSSSAISSGVGTVDDPYVIDGGEIDAGNHDYGIRIEHTDSYVVIKNLKITGANQAAISLSFAKHVRISTVTVDGNWIGISATFCSDIAITDSTLENNTDAIHLFFSRKCQLARNHIERNDTGIWLDASDNNAIAANTLLNNHSGIYLNLGAQDNLIHRNAFRQQQFDAVATSPNSWSYNGSGNYWSKYSGSDSNNDGIGDSAYVIANSDNTDDFPLMSAP